MPFSDCCPGILKAMGATMHDFKRACGMDLQGATRGKCRGMAWRGMAWREDGLSNNRWPLEGRWFSLETPQ